MSFMFLMVSGAGLSAIADVPAPGVTICVVGVSAVPFAHAVAGGPAVTYYTIGLSDYSI